MTQRERLNQDDEVVFNSTPAPVRGRVAADETVATVRSEERMPAMAAPTHVYDTPDVHEHTTVTTPVDSVRWGPIVAGLFTALSTLAVLSLLGLAIGAASYDAGDRARDYGIGAGLWGGLSALLAFFAGGWLAARTSAVRGERNGLLNGAMVWALAIPLLLYLLTSGIGAATRTAGNIAAAGSQAAAQAADGNVTAGQAQDAAGNAVNNAQQQIDAAVTPQRIDNAADATGRGLLGTLGSLLLGLGAASLGGYFGSRAASGRRGFSNLV